MVRRGGERSIYPGEVFSAHIYTYRNGGWEVEASIFAEI